MTLLEWFMPVGTIIMTAMVAWLLWKWLSRPDYSRMPPSLPTLPLIGNIHQLARCKSFCNLTETAIHELGDIFTLWVGPQPTVLIGEHTLAKEAFVKLAQFTSDRLSNSKMLDMVTHGYKGVIFCAPGKEHTRNRRICLSALRDLFCNKNAACAKMLDKECKLMLKKIIAASADDQAVDTEKYMFETTTRIMGGTCFGQEFVDNEKKVEAIRTISMHGFKALTPRIFLLITMFPLLRFVPFFDLDAAMTFLKQRDPFVSTELSEHRKTRQPDAPPRDVTDALIESTDMTEDDRLVLVGDLLFAGSSTVSSAMEWIVYCLIVYPEWQTKLQTEVDDVIGSVMDLSGVQMQSLPQLCAFYNEVQRWSNHLPTGIMHATSGEITLKGYKIPKGTNLNILIHVMNHSEEHWDKPKEFNPSRFIHDNGTFVVPTKTFVPFSLGPRSCLGDGLAKRELFFMLLYIVYYLKLSPEVEGQFPSKENPTERTTVHPQPFKVKVQTRRPFTSD